MNQRVKSVDTGPSPRSGDRLHPAWVALIRHCQQLGYGTIERLKIQDGLPVLAEESIKQTKFL